MGLLCDYFTAAPDAQAEETIAWIGGPANPRQDRSLVRGSQVAARPAVSLPRIEPAMWMGKLEVLTGRSFDDILRDPAGKISASRDGGHGGELNVVSLTAGLQDALAGIDDETIDEAQLDGQHPVSTTVPARIRDSPQVRSGTSPAGPGRPRAG